MVGKLAGNWKKTKTEGGEAFFAAFEVPAEQLQRAASSTLETVIKIDGDSMSITRTYTLPDG